MLGRLTRNERISFVVGAGLLLGFIAQPLHGIHPTWIAVFAFAALGAMRVITVNTLRSVNWSFALLFVAALTLLCFAVSFVLRWQAAAPLITIALAPVAGAPGRHRLWRRDTARALRERHRLARDGTALNSRFVPTSYRNQVALILGDHLRLPPMIPNQATRAVLFVDISGSTRLYETLGDEQALARVGSSLAMLSQVCEDCGGRVIKTTGDGAMCVFETADAALRASRLMQEKTEEQQHPGEPNLGIHIGCHFGPVLENAGDFYGDTVNLAARVAGLAKVGQIITTEDTVSKLSPGTRRARAQAEPACRSRASRRR